MSKLTNGTWVVIADGEKFLILENVTDDENPHFQVRRKEEEENPKDIEQSANRPGRMPDTGQGQRSALDDTDWHELQKERFAADLADDLYKAAHAGKFEKIVIAAAPQILGQLRQDMHQEVEQKVIGEIAKNLTNHPIEEIEEIVKADLAA